MARDGQRYKEVEAILICREEELRRPVPGKRLQHLVDARVSPSGETWLLEEVSDVAIPMAPAYGAILTEVGDGYGAVRTGEAKYLDVIGEYASLNGLARVVFEAHVATKALVGRDIDLVIVVGSPATRTRARR